MVLTANADVSPDVGPKALKIRSRIQDFIAAEGASLAAIAPALMGSLAARQTAANQRWASDLQAKSDISHPGLSSEVGKLRTGGVVPTTDQEAAVDDLIAIGRAPALCAFQVKLPEAEARVAASKQQQFVKINAAALPAHFGSTWPAWDMRQLGQSLD